jgi:ribosomal protein L29
MTKKESLLNKADPELLKQLSETRAALRGERFAAAGARPKDSNAPKKLRTTIARILTEQHARTHHGLGEIKK